MRPQNDPQIRQDIDQQHGYGEAQQRDLPLDQEDATPERPLGEAGEPDREDHGFLRNDGEARPAGSPDRHLDRVDNPVTDPDDPRHPEMPDMAGDDIGPKSPEPAHRPKADGHLLQDAYSANKPEEPKD